MKGVLINADEWKVVTVDIRKNIGLVADLESSVGYIDCRMVRLAPNRGWTVSESSLVYDFGESVVMDDGLTFWLDEEERMKELKAGFNLKQISTDFTGTMPCSATMWGEARSVRSSENVTMEMRRVISNAIIPIKRFKPLIGRQKISNIK